MSLVLGVLSLSCLGFVAGIPAVILGLTAKSAIDKSGGMVGGSGVALGGIVTGALGTVWSTVLTTVFVASMVIAAHAPAPTPLTVPTARPVATAAAARGPHAMGRVSVTDLVPGDGALRDQLDLAAKRARGEGRTLVVQTTATWCSVCREVEGSLGDAKMQAALGSVSLVRVDVDEFDAELKFLQMSEGSVPWFYRVDSAVHATDAISADEWDANVPDNMAPVLKAFVGGTLNRRRHPNPIGTAL